MAPTGSSHVNASLGALCAAGGLFGYWKARSMPSLLAGLTFGGAYAAGAYLINSGDPATGHMAGLVSSMLLTGAMGTRWARTGKFMPAGIMTVAGVLGSYYNFQKHQDWTS
eukprot:GHRR01006403.1.p1 GENE.GHRR01006403.1~~GHRR01006403.1.p1  ORF type:complete len:111 (+),score=23.51 GHRR01006403.1:160-492(+)